MVTTTDERISRSYLTNWNGSVETNRLKEKKDILYEEISRDLLGWVGA